MALSLAAYTTAGSLMLTVLSIYGINSNLFTSKGGSNLVKYGLKLGFFWGLLGSFLLILSPTLLDASMHLITLGWGVTILFALSIHITSVIGSFKPKHDWLNLLLLVVWQFIVLSRTLLAPVPIVIQITVALMAFFWTYWLIAIILRSNVIMFRRRKGVTH